jgi:hypothetical protein
MTSVNATFTNASLREMHDGQIDACGPSAHRNSARTVVSVILELVVALISSGIIVELLGATDVIASDVN